MPNVTPLSREELADFEATFRALDSGFGFVPNSMLTMGRRPEILRAFSALGGAVLGPGAVPRTLKQMVAFVASNAAGCRYCQAHTSDQAHRAGVDAAKIDALYSFETSPLFDDGERAALRLARDAAIVPNATGPGHFVALAAHFTPEQVVEIVAVISLFGFLNRWNDTMATTLEEEPVAFGHQHLAAHGWETGKHAG
jgi:uncharacterized peroxidase-related enzyme